LRVHRSGVFFLHRKWVKKMNYLRVINLEKFQHYKHRNPPWIKLHNSIMDNYHFACLQDASKLHLILIWLLASRTNNTIPDDSEWIRRRIGVSSKVDVESLVSHGFIERYSDASKMLASCVQNADSERETETETEKTPLPPKGEGVSSPEFEAFWSEWPPHPRKSAKGQTATSWRRQKCDPIAGKIMAALACWKTSTEWTKNNGQFIPAPKVFINQRRWESSPPSPTESVPTENPFAAFINSELNHDKK